MNSLVFLPNECEELRSIINDLKSNKSTGVNGVQVNTIKDIAEFILEPLKHIIDLSMETGVWHTAFNEVAVVPRRTINLGTTNVFPLSATYKNY